MKQKDKWVSFWEDKLKRVENNDTYWDVVGVRVTVTEPPVLLQCYFSEVQATSDQGSLMKTDPYCAVRKKFQSSLNFRGEWLPHSSINVTGAPLLQSIGKILLILKRGGQGAVTTHLMEEVSHIQTQQDLVHIVSVSLSTVAVYLTVKKPSNKYKMIYHLKQRLAGSQLLTLRTF